MNNLRYNVKKDRQAGWLVIDPAGYPVRALNSRGAAENDRDRRNARLDREAREARRQADLPTYEGATP